MLEYLSKEYYMNTISQWLIAFAFIAGGIIIAKIAYLIFCNIVKGLTKKTKSRLDDILLVTLKKPSIYGITVLGFYLGMEYLHKTDEMVVFITKIYHVLIVIGVTWFLVRLVNAVIEEYMEPVIERSDSDFDDQLLPIIKKLVAIAIWGIGIIIALNNAGYNVGALIAGLGIGGLAFALAAKDYIENIFGGISVFTDKPFTVNDRVRVDGFDGKVEEIGIRRSRIRTLNGTLVTIPNAKFIHNSVENVALELNRKVTLKLGLTYDTNAEGIETAMNILKDIIKENLDNVTEEPVVFFENFGDFSLIINFIYYIKKEADIPSTQNKINLEILKRYEKAALDFAFPTQTIYNIKQ
ncbi:mechanosensitive ion channel family protein [Aquimarina latercula]|uniref:mechanosensitive ion channel family protein n=1 Tax=Aquimarina latercula TaxID=987 RepID=UPI0004298074|nr:mechanosensitive ion channel family protein [Aquimarina latercula]